MCISQQHCAAIFKDCGSRVMVCYVEWHIHCARKPDMEIALELAACQTVHPGSHKNCKAVFESQNCVVFVTLLQHHP